MYQQYLSVETKTMLLLGTECLKPQFFTDLKTLGNH